MEYLKAIDIISPKMELKIKSQPRFKTNLGGLFSIFCILSCSVLSCYFTIQAFSGQIYTTTYNQELDPNPTFNMSRTPLMINILGPSIQPYADIDSVLSVQVRFFEYINYTTHITPINISRCTSDYEGVATSSFKDMLIANAFCVDMKSLASNPIFGTITSSAAFNYVSILLNRCSNDTETNKTNCKSDEDLDFMLSVVTVNIIMRDYNIDNRQIQEPGTPYLKIMTYLASSTIFKQFFIDIANTIYSSDEGLVFQNEIIYNYFSTQPISESADNRDLGTLGNFCE